MDKAFGWKKSEIQNIERQDQPYKITRETESLRDTQPHINAL